MKEVKSLRILWGGIAIAIYAGLIALLLFYFNSRHASKPKHFVKKNEKRIQLASSKRVEAIKVKTIVEKTKTPKEKPLPKKESLKTTVQKRIPKKITKKVHKEKIVKKPKPKKRDENRTKVKKHTPIKINKPKVKKPKKSDTHKPKKVPKKTSDLFATVRAKAKKNESLKQNKPKSASQKITESIKNQKESQSGVENAYYAKVQSLLETWPAQSDYAGEKAMVHLYVKPTGLFEFKVKSQSDNVEFNLGLIDFLMQLQKLGFGTHKSGKTYEFEVEFIAKE